MTFKFSHNSIKALKTLFLRFYLVTIEFNNFILNFFGQPVSKIVHVCSQIILGGWGS